ncbi:MAG: type II toxin-antitoxin system PemK/MazF family toxin [Polyangiaceae bacterium]
MRRGEIWWAKLPLPAGRRPVVLVSRDSAYTVRSSVSVVEISRTVRGIPTEVPLGKREGLPKPCVANADSIATIPKTWLESRIGPLGTEKTKTLDAALRFSLGLG